MTDNNKAVLAKLEAAGFEFDEGEYCARNVSVTIDENLDVTLCLATPTHRYVVYLDKVAIDANDVEVIEQTVRSVA